MSKFKIDKASQVPLYAQLADAVRSKVKNGELKGSDPLPFMEELSRELKINMTTVRRSFDILQKEGMIQKIKGTGSFIKNIQTEDKWKKRVVSNLCFIGPVDMHDNEGRHYFAPMLKGLNEAAENNGMGVLVMNQNRNISGKMLKENGVAGAYIAGIHDEKIIREVIACGIPVVVGEVSLDIPGCDYINYEIFESAEKLARLLIENGHRDIMYIEGIMKDINGRMVSLKGNEARLLALEKTIKAAEKPVRLSKISSLVKVYSSFSEGMKVCEKKNIPTAFFAFSDTIAEGITLALLKSGLKIPCDASVVGLGGFEKEELDMQVTTMKFDRIEMGRVAAERLLQRIAGKVSTGIRINLPGEFIHGETLGKARKK